MKWMSLQILATTTIGLRLIAEIWGISGASCTPTTLMGRFIASNALTAQAAIAIIATHTELWCGKMVAVKRNTADQGIGHAENTTLVPDISIHLMLAHVLVTRTADMITHLVVLVTRGRQVAVVQPTQVQWLIVVAWVAHGAFCTLT